MACSTCGDTMYVICSTDSESVRMCLRCGTTEVHRWDGDQPEDEHEPKVYVPKLVERCRDFQHWLPTMCDITRAGFATSGIAESINVPEVRPPAA